MFSSTMSRMDNKYMQVSITEFDWDSVHPIISRSETHETLSLLLVYEDVLHTGYILINNKEIIYGTFYHNFENAACQFKQLEPNTPWSNGAEWEIEVLKKGASYKLQ